MMDPLRSHYYIEFLVPKRFYGAVLSLDSLYEMMQMFNCAPHEFGLVGLGRKDRVRMSGPNTVTVELYNMDRDLFMLWLLMHGDKILNSEVVFGDACPSWYSHLAPPSKFELK